MVASSNYYPKIDQFVLAGELLEETVRALREEGRDTVESIVFWAGGVSDSIATISTLLIPKGAGVSRHPLQVRVDDRTMAAVCDHLDPPRSVLLGQVHTHRDKAFHSWADDQFSLDTPGFLSIVVPRFARDGVDTWTEWAFFVCAGGGRFQEMSRQVVARRFRVEGSLRLESHDVTPS